MTDRTVKDIVLDFNLTVNKLIKCVSMRVKNNVDSDNLDRVKKRIQLYKSYRGEDALLIAASKYLLHYADKIKSKNLQFLFEIDPAIECKMLGTTIESSDAYMIELFTNVKKSCEEMNEKEKGYIMDDIYNLYKCYLEYIIVS